MNVVLVVFERKRRRKERTGKGNDGIVTYCDHGVLGHSYIYEIIAMQKSVLKEK